MYKIVESFNENTKLALCNKKVYVLKKISLEDVPVMKKLISLDNPYIVKFYDFCEVDGTFYVVEEYIQGVTLEEYAKANFPLDEKMVNDIACSLCVGLSGVHGLGIVHRDVNPSNIMIDNSGVVKLIDFGISRSVSRDKRLDTHILGTQGYAAPEQYGFSQTNAKSDIYSLGVVINYMLTLKMPSVQKAEGYFAPIISKCIEIDENKRYGSADELLNDLKIKHKSAGVFRTMPGLRPGTSKPKRIAAIIFYAAFVYLESMVMIFDSSSGVKTMVYDFFALLFALLIPVLLGGNFLNYLDAFWLTRYKSKQTRTVWKVIFIIISLVIAGEFILISQAK